jgi:cholesterol transport system auxiliary component
MNQRMNGSWKLGAALLGALLLAGCGALKSGVKPDRIYVLTPAQAAAGGTVVPGLLLVPRPAVQPGLETDRIALTRPGNELDYYAASRWGAALPPVLAAFVVQSMHGSFTTVSSAERGAGPGDFELLLTVRHFEAEYGSGGTPTVRVALDCLLVSRAPRRVVGNCDAEVREPAGDNRMAPIVAAFETATRKALEQVREKVVAAAQAVTPAVVAPVPPALAAPVPAR